jgi:ABC-type dipeptide/oligopeptide/nickel transport system permease subunit
MSFVKTFLYLLERNRLALACFAVIVMIVVAAVLAPVISPYDPNEPNLKNKLSAPSRAHWLGTDQLGRDVFSRIVWGARVSLKVGIVAVGIAFLLGTAIGMFGAYFGKWSDEISMRGVDIMLSFPMILLSILIIAFFGSSLWNVMLAIGISLSPRFARLARGLTLSVKELEYIEAARAMGAGRLRICIEHVFPNILTPLMVTATLYVSTAILIESSLSYMGLGVQPPDPTWGSIINEGRQVIRIMPWISIFAGLAITITILALNILGDALRDALDPNLRGQI